jgi:hypothetical protein
MGKGEPPAHTIRMNFSAPQNEDEFERLCLRLLQVHWKCLSLVGWPTLWFARVGS